MIQKNSGEILDKKNEFEGQAIVCFIDILGFSDDIKNNWDNKNKSDPSHPLKRILNIKQQAKEFCEDVIEKAFHDELPKNQISHHIIVTSISDSFVIRFGFDDEVTPNNDYFKTGISGVIWTAMGIWLSCILNGYTVRGAIDLGNAYWNDDSIIGNTFINVYELESKVAKNSRIIVSSNLNKILERFFTEFRIENSAYQNALIEMFIKDVDGYIILNPRLMLITDPNSPDYLVRSILEIQEKAKGINKEKYNPLIYMLKNNNSTPLTYADFGLY